MMFDLAAVGLSVVLFLIGGLLGLLVGYGRAGRMWANNINDVFGICYGDRVYKVITSEQYSKFIALSDDEDDDYSNVFRMVRRSNGAPQPVAAEK